MEDARPRRIGLALSGGGFRATLFHLGVVRLLRESGQLSSIKRVGAVSGGSILAAHLVLLWDQYVGSAQQFDTAAQEIIQFVQNDVRGRVVRKWILAWLTLLPRILMPKPWRWTFTNLLQGYYAGLYRDAPLKALGDPHESKDDLSESKRPRVFLYCASLTTGAVCSFDRTRFTWHRREEKDEERSIAAPNTPIAFAVAASSAFPPLFPPIEISNETLFCDRDRFPNPHYLTDGGVYDNLGIDRLISHQQKANDLDLFVVSDAEGRFDSEFDTQYTSVVGRNVRASDLLMTRVSSLQLKSLMSQTIPVVRIGINEEIIDQVDARQNQPTMLSPEAQRSLPNPIWINLRPRR